MDLSFDDSFYHNEYMLRSGDKSDDSNDYLPILTTSDDYDDDDNGHDVVHDHEEPDYETDEVDSMDAILGLSLRSRGSMDPSTQIVSSSNENIPTQLSCPKRSTK